MSTIKTEEQWEAEGLGIAGRQLVTRGNCRVGDLQVWQDSRTILTKKSELGRIGSGCWKGERIYRKIPVAKHGDLDHDDVIMLKHCANEVLKEELGLNKNIADKAIDLVCGDRNASYGNPADDYAGTAKVWSGLLHRKLKEDITPREAILMMAAMKINREIFKPKEDSRIDAIGYMLCADWATTGKQPSKANNDLK